MQTPDRQSGSASGSDRRILNFGEDRPKSGSRSGNRMLAQSLQYLVADFQAVVAIGYSQQISITLLHEQQGIFVGLRLVFAPFASGTQASRGATETTALVSSIIGAVSTQHQHYLNGFSG